MSGPDLTNQIIGVLIRFRQVPIAIMADIKSMSYQMRVSQSGLFGPSFLIFLESDFALLWCETLHSEVAWTEENAGKSEFTLFAAWLITLHKVL